MRNTWILYRKELKSYFSSPIGYAIMAIYAVVFGFVFYQELLYFLQIALRVQEAGRQVPLSINEIVIGPVLRNVGIFGLFLIPFLTMRLFAEEKRTGTIELLLTSPVRDSELVFAKWFAAFTLYANVLAVCALNFVWLFGYGRPDWKPLVIGYLGLLLQGGALLAIGTFISTLTKNQIIAGVAGSLVSLLLLLLYWASSFETTVRARVVSYISISTHLESFFKGVLDSRDVVFFVSLIFLGLFLSARSLDSLRWRA